MRKKKRLRNTRPVFGLSVWQSPIRSRFPLKIIGTLPGSDGGQILARAYGSVIKRMGGVPLGSSGSPVYRGSRLFGAIAAVFAPDYCLVAITPIDAMTALVNEPSPPPSVLSQASGCKLSTPLISGGISSKKGLAALLRRYGNTQTAFSPAETNIRTRELHSGDPIGAALLTGDIQIGFIGTTTLIRNKQVFAFGHPLLFQGPTCMPLTEAHIITTSQGEAPEKLGYLGAIIGTVYQDRSAGILAELGKKDRLISLQLAVLDLDRKKTTVLYCQAAPIAGELPFLIYIATLEAMQRAMNRIGAGTAIWQWQIVLSEDEEVLETTASQYDETDISTVVATSGKAFISQKLQEHGAPKSIELVATVTCRALTDYVTKTIGL